MNIFRPRKQVLIHHFLQIGSALHALSQPNVHLEGLLLPFLAQIRQGSNGMLHDWPKVCFPV